VVTRSLPTCSALRIPQYLMQTFAVDGQHAGCHHAAGYRRWRRADFAELLSLGTFSAFILFLPILMRGVGDLAAFVRDLSRAS
jgi:hypothetical protein